MRPTVFARLFLLCIAVPLAGCPRTPTYVAQPEAITASGDFVQATSGMKFPDHVDDFRRVAATLYDKDGLDVSAGYNLMDPTAPVIATVYVYPAPPLVSIGSPADVIAAARVQLCQDEFARRKAEIAHAHPDAVLLGEQDFTLPRKNGPFPGKKASYEFDYLFGGTRLRAASELYVFCYVAERWAVEYRFTSPRDAASADKISSFMSGLPWTISGGS
jgi:hypothetical protein